MRICRKVPAVVFEMASYRQWADPLLRQESDKLTPHHQRSFAEHDLLPVDGGQVDFLYRRLLTARADEVPVIRNALLTAQECVDREQAMVRRR